MSTEIHNKIRTCAEEAFDYSEVIIGTDSREDKPQYVCVMRTKGSPVAIYDYRNGTFRFVRVFDNVYNDVDVHNGVVYFSTNSGLEGVKVSSGDVVGVLATHNPVVSSAMDPDNTGNLVYATFIGDGDEGRSEVYVYSIRDGEWGSVSVPYEIQGKVSELRYIDNAVLSTVRHGVVKYVYLTYLPSVDEGWSNVNVPAILHRSDYTSGNRFDLRKAVVLDTLGGGKVVVVTVGKTALVWHLNPDLPVVVDIVAGLLQVELPEVILKITGEHLTILEGEVYEKG